MKTYFNYVSVGQKNSLVRTSFLVTYGTHTVGEVSLRALKDIMLFSFPTHHDTGQYKVSFNKTVGLQ